MRNMPAPELTSAGASRYESSGPVPGSNWPGAEPTPGAGDAGGDVEPGDDEVADGDDDGVGAT